MHLDYKKKIELVIQKQLHIEFLILQFVAHIIFSDTMYYYCIEMKYYNIIISLTIQRDNTLIF